MSKFTVKFQRDFEVDIEVESTAHAQVWAQTMILQFPKETCKILSIIREGVEVETTPDKPPTPFGRPNGGGSPGTPVIRVETLVDQIAEAA